MGPPGGLGGAGGAGGGSGPSGGQQGPQQGRPVRQGRVVRPGLPAGCAHRLDVWAEQRWRWRVMVRCRLCGRQVEMPGRWWREADVEAAVLGVLRRIDGAIGGA